MNNSRPSLLRYLLHQHLAASSITLLLMLLIVLFLADYIALQSAAYTMAQDLRKESLQTFLSDGMQGGRGGRIMLDADGKLSDGNGWQHRGNGRGSGWRQMAEEITWPQSKEVLAKGEMTGTTSLPWISQNVVWAARVINNDGKSYILLMWNRTSTIRSSAKMTYYLIIAGVALAFFINMIFLVRTIRNVSKTINDVTTAGQQMVKENFAVSIPPQQTAELDNLSNVILDLSFHLDQTLADLRREQDRLVQLEQMQRQFVADASHELRAPLSAMGLTLDAWHDGLLTPEEHSDAIIQLRTEVKRLGRMVAQLLDLSRIESGRENIKCEPVYLYQIVSKVTDILNSMPGAMIVNEIPQKLMVIADEDALYRIIRNLIDNARRFTPADGKITIWVKEIDDRVQIGVSDTGCGIPESVINRIWDRFSRAERERSGDDCGTGLGLAIVKSLAEIMGGEVGIDSKEGYGTNVWVFLKRYENVI